MADQLCTKTQVKARLNDPDVVDDVLIDELIDEVSDWIQDTTGRRLVPENTATYVVDTSAGSVIRVKRGIRAVTSLGVASSNQPDAGGTYTAVTLADVVLRPQSIDRKPGWPATAIMLLGSAPRLGAWINGATISGDFGWAATPPVIQGVAIDAVVTAYHARQGGAVDVIGDQDTPIYPWARYFSRGSPQRATIDRYRAGAGIA